MSALLLLRNQAIPPFLTGIGSTEAFGSQVLTNGPQINPEGIATAEAFGIPGMGLYLTGLIDSDEGVGIPMLVFSNIPGIPSTSRLVQPTRGPITVEQT